MKHRLCKGLIGEVEYRRFSITTKQSQVSCLEVSGTGQTAVFLHGLGTSASLWLRAMVGLADIRRCVAIDLPLHGHSPLGPGQVFSLPALADLVVEVCDELGIRTFDLLANDTGGAVAQVVAAHHEQRLATLTLTNCEVYDNIPTQAFMPTYRIARTGLLAPLARAMMLSPSLARRTAYGAGFEDVELALAKPLAQEWLTPLFGSLDRARAFQRCILSIRAEDLVAVQSRVAVLDVPTYLIWGTGDTFFPVGWAFRLAKTIPGVRSLDFVSGGRLFFPHERAEDLIAVVRRNWIDGD